MKVLIYLFAFILIVTRVSAQDTVISRHYEIQYGTVPNIESGSLSSVSISSLAFDQISLAIDNEIHNRTITCFTRIANFGLIQFYFGAQLYGTIPHEYFGHYNRAREFGVTPALHLNFPALGGDNVFLVTQNMPVIERQMIAAAGPEVTADIAYKATQQLYSDDHSPNYIGNFLIGGKLIDQFIYLQNNVKPFLDNPNKYYLENADFIKRNPVPNDPLAYALALTESYGYYDGFINKDSIWVQQFPDMSVYTQNKFILDQYRRMKTAYMITALDPTNLYFIYGNALYLIKGQTFFKPFMFRIKGVSFMPSVRANMGELGIENYYDIFFKIKNFPYFNVYYRNGGNLFNHVNGAGTEFRNIKVTNRIKLNGQLDYWNNDRNKTNNFNFMAGFQLYDKKQLIFFSGNIGCKSYGGLMGKPFDKGVYGSFGCGLNLNYKNE